MNFIGRQVVIPEKCRMKDITDTLLNRTSIRRYEGLHIEPEKLDLIYDAIIHSPTSYNGQQYSVIAIDNQETKEELYSLTGEKQIKTCDVFLVFCADYYKIETIARKKRLQVPPFRQTLDGIMVGTIDATIAMCNARIMAESLGLGCCCIGYIRTAAPREVSTLLNLPQGVFLVCGLTIGYPREQPNIKPKQEKSLLIHRNSYQHADIAERLLKYDETISQYNRRRSLGITENDWCNHMIDYYKAGMQYGLLSYLEEQDCGVGQEAAETI